MAVRQDRLEGCPGYHISQNEFEVKTLRVLKLARSALIYLSLAVYREEQMRHTDEQGPFHLF
ncbi:LA2681 family HEPN domain-containing protein [Pseudovibrio exalbescens]|uniref:LA2681 family HEPN domain-containing protein n=1 Tax=Pseudovibrio exalbescens TaxID=197461 RepID=UPI003CC7D664